MNPGPQFGLGNFCSVTRSTRLAAAHDHVKIKCIYEEDSMQYKYTQLLRNIIYYVNLAQVILCSLFGILPEALSQEQSMWTEKYYAVKWRLP